MSLVCRNVQCQHLFWPLVDDESIQVFIVSPVESSCSKGWWSLQAKAGVWRSSSGGEGWVMDWTVDQLKGWKQKRSWLDVVHCFMMEQLHVNQTFWSIWAVFRSCCFMSSIFFSPPPFSLSQHKTQQTVHWLYMLPFPIFSFWFDWSRLSGWWAESFLCILVFSQLERNLDVLVWLHFFDGTRLKNWSLSGVL